VETSPSDLVGNRTKLGRPSKEMCADLFTRLWKRSPTSVRPTPTAGPAAKRKMAWIFTERIMVTIAGVQCKAKREWAAHEAHEGRYRMLMVEKSPKRFTPAIEKLTSSLTNR